MINIPHWILCIDNEGDYVKNNLLVIINAFLSLGYQPINSPMVDIILYLQVYAH